MARMTGAKGMGRTTGAKGAVVTKTPKGVEGVDYPHFNKPAEETPAEKKKRYQQEVAVGTGRVYNY